MHKLSRHVEAVVILPTTEGRGQILPLSVGSVLRQTLQNLELWIIGDGVDEATRAIIHELMAADARIRFFDHPGHISRGEPYRHAALRDARCDFVAYICDRDLFLPDHLQTLAHRLRNHDFVTSNRYEVRRDQSIELGFKVHGYGAVADTTTPLARLGGHKLSSVGHTLSAYRALPYGWRTTPAGQCTDRYMWRQFFSQAGLRVFHEARPTFLYFKRGDYPGPPIAERFAELTAWVATLDDPAAWALRRNEAMEGLLNKQVQQRTAFMLLRGASPLLYLRRLARRQYRKIKPPTTKGKW